MQSSRPPLARHDFSLLTVAFHSRELESRDSVVDRKSRGQLSQLRLEIRLGVEPRNTVGKCPDHLSGAKFRFRPFASSTGKLKRPQSATRREIAQSFPQLANTGCR